MERKNDGSSNSKLLIPCVFHSAQKFSLCMHYYTTFLSSWQPLPQQYFGQSQILHLKTRSNMSIRNFSAKPKCEVYNLNFLYQKKS